MDHIRAALARGESYRSIAAQMEISRQWLSRYARNNRLVKLEWATQSANHHHAVRTGLRRIVRGEDCYNAVLTDTKVRAIIDDLMTGVPRVQLAAQQNVSVGTISDIVRGERWAHIPRPSGFERLRGAPRPRVTAAQEEEIRAGLARGESQCSIAARMGVSRDPVRRIAQELRESAAQAPAPAAA
jgi:predicted DNA-binding protein (UPF0251 family)